ncbi:MAG: replication initiator protein A [Cyanobacteria bacterium P01_A01_bin.17]
MSEPVIKQLALFAEDRNDLPLKDDRVLMEYPFFSIRKQPLMEPIVYRNGDTEIVVEPGPRGIATMWDKEVLIYLASILNERINRGEHVSRTIHFVAADFLKWTKRGTGKRSYELLLNALDRLRSTNIKTSIASAEVRERRGFGWIETWRAIEQKRANGKSVMVAVEVTINQWMFRAITQDRRVLTLSKEYFGMSKGLERRFYELARKHCGNQKKWSISLPKLKDKCGSSREMRRFKADVMKLVKQGNLPGYSLEVDATRDPSRCLVTFRPKKKSAPHPAQILPRESWSLSTDAFVEAKAQYPSYDIDFLAKEWRRWAENKHSEPPQDANKAFLAFCATYIARNPM